MALSDNLVWYYPLDEASGNAIDAVGTLDLTDNNTVGSGTGKVAGTARDFENGNSEYFSRASSSEFVFGDIDWTMTLWCQLESKTAWRQLVTKFSNTVYEYAIVYDQTTDRFACYAGTGVSNVQANNFGSPSVTTWYFIAVRYTASTNTLSISVNDGTPNTTSITAVSGSVDFNIGYRTDGASEYMDGLIEQVGGWKRVLSDAEITELYNSGSGRDYSYITGGGGGGISDRPLQFNQSIQRASRW